MTVTANERPAIRRYRKACVTARTAGLHYSAVVASRPHSPDSWGSDAFRSGSGAFRWGWHSGMPLHGPEWMTTMSDHDCVHYVSFDDEDTDDLYAFSGNDLLISITTSRTLS